MLEKLRIPIVLTFALASIVSVLPATARAQQDDLGLSDGPRGNLQIGKSYAFGGGTDLQSGFGLDLRYALYPDQDMDGYLGLLAQGEYQTGDAWRFVGGVTAGWGVFGLEVGISHRTETAGFAGSTGLHVGQAFTFGPLSIGARLTIPLVDHVSQNIMVPPLATQGIEGALVVRLGFDFQVHGQRSESNGHGCHGHGGGGELRNPHSDHGSHGGQL